MRFELKKCDETVSLVHLTTEDRLPGIMEYGIIPSAYGDFVVGGNDGAGIYAVRPNRQDVEKALCLFSGSEEQVIAIQFHYSGVFYECMGAELTDDEDADPAFSKGFIVIPQFNFQDKFQIRTDDFERIVPAEYYLTTL